MKPDSDNPLPEERGKRLDSWKQIAAFLNRDVRTAHRWELDEGLPVHRHQHSKRGTVYAYTAEIEAWLQDRSEAGVSTTTPPRRASARETVIAALALAAVALAAVALAAVALVVLSIFGLGNRDVVETVPTLIAATENRTGEARFEGVIENYLAGELSAPGMAIIPPRRIIDTLLLMREPTDRVLDMATMLEISARIPEVRLIARSAIDRFDSEYLLTVDLLDSVSGATLRSARSQATREAYIPTALEALVADVRAALRTIEVEEREALPGYEPVTTRSRRAAELYWAAAHLMFDNPVQMPGAEEHLREATELDPEFATAFIQLAHAIHEQDRPVADWAPFAERALQLADSVSDAERIFITGSYHKLHGNLEEAQASFLALNASFPEHFWGQLHMAELSHARNNLEGAAWSMALAADLQPESIEFQYTAFNFILTTPHTWTLPRIRDRLIEINPLSQNGNVHPFMPVEFYDVNQLLMDDRADEALAELRLKRRKLDDIPNDVWTRPSTYAARLAEVFLAFGQLGEAEDLLEFVRRDDSDIPRNTPLRRILEEQRLLGMLAISRGSSCCLDHDFGQILLPETAILDIRAGRTEFDGTNIATMIEADEPIARILRGEIARRNGDLEAAIALLGSALDSESERLANLGLAPGLANPTRAESLLAADGLAAALIDDSRPEDALRVLELWSNDQMRVAASMASPSFAPYWILLRSRLESLYREAGRLEEAASVRSELAALLEAADEDHFVAQQSG